MNIHILFAAYQSDRGSNGGMESATRIFETLKDDFRWTLLTNRETPRTERWRAGGARVVRFPFDERRRRTVRALQLGQLSLRIASIVMRDRPALIHANDVRTAQATIPVSRLSRLPFIYTMRDTKGKRQTYSATWYKAARYADSFIVLSDEMGLLARQRFGARQLNLRTINSIVDLHEFKPRTLDEIFVERKRLGIEAEKYSIGIVAAVTEKKGQLNFLQEAMPKLIDSNITLHLVGDFNPDKERYACACADAVQTKDLTRSVKFHGFCKNVADWMAALDLIVITSENEGLARCMIEAMASGTPVVSFDVCSAHEMLEITGAGLVVKQQDFSSLARSIARLAANEQQRQAMGRAGRKAAEARFAVERVAAQWRDVYGGFVQRPTTQSERGD